MEIHHQVRGHKGLGKRKSDVTSEEDDGFVDEETEDEDNPFA